MKYREKAFVHLIWVIALLLAVISALLWRLPNGSDLAGFIAFAASLASLVLATVAIFQSILFSATINRSISSIEASSERILSETQRLQEASIELSAEASASLSRLSSLPDQVVALRGDIADRFDEFSSFEVSPNVDRSDLQEDLSPHDIVNVMNNNSYNFGLSIMMLYGGAKTGLAFEPDDVLPPDDFRYPAYYAQGLIETFMVYRLCDVSINGAGGRFIVQSLGKIDMNAVETYFAALTIKSETVRDAFLNVEKHFDLDILTSMRAQVSGGNSEPGGD